MRDPWGMSAAQCRARLIEIGVAVGGPLGEEIAELASRFVRKGFHPSKATSAPCTAAMRQAMRDYHKAHPEASYMQIAWKFQVNVGRVSEAVHGGE